MLDPAVFEFIVVLFLPPVVLLPALPLEPLLPPVVEKLLLLTMLEDVLVL